ncbi:hypothetical protein B6N60_05052 [Richelia sinica FACHB-800]|uniref:Alpha/beta hydrolase n=1 Tax=Richelia sinica FACHB-800 TaxID=1357546 RepID=A0A975TE40_9NOST|nr:alpha/beta hydrolase [Richelia sinica]MBD2663950.1 alpha/beta hydrolase [Richelia sinica FACHB-800]QXE26321.1 hypothetical protein B6N60_05052 [Richelia sinica FACHB-800]
MPIYGPDQINFDGVDGHRYWFYHPFSYTGMAEIDDKLSGFPVAIFLPSHRPASGIPLVIGLQGMCAPYGWNAFIISTLTQMGIAVALFDTPFAGERSLVRTFTALVQQEIKPLVEQGIAFDTELLFTLFSRIAIDINTVHQFCAEKYGISLHHLALFGVSMGVLESAYAFTANSLGERLLGVIGHADIKSFAKSWGHLLLPDLAASPLGRIAESTVLRLQPELNALFQILKLTKHLKSLDEYANLCNPMTYIDRVKLPRRARFLVGANDPLVNTQDARICAENFPDGDCYVVPGLGHGTRQWGPDFVQHVRYFLQTQLGDWQS